MMMGAINSEGQKDRRMIFGISELLEGSNCIRLSVLFCFHLFVCFPPEFLLEHRSKYIAKVLRAS